VTRTWNLIRARKCCRPELKPPSRSNSIPEPARQCTFSLQQRRSSGFAPDLMTDQPGCRQDWCWKTYLSFPPSLSCGRYTGTYRSHRFPGTSSSPSSACTNSALTTLTLGFPSRISTSPPSQAARHSRQANSMAIATISPRESPGISQFVPV
jgi:hypothetical protein